MTPPRPISLRSGFTLIELLATIGIIALLSALLFPAVGKVRGKADAIQCTSNMRQLHLAYMQEVAENDGTLPKSYASGKSWTELYAESLGGNWQVADGGARMASSTGCPAQIRKLKLGVNRRTLAINIRLTDNEVAAKGGNPPKLAFFSFPSKTVLFADGPIKSATSTQNVFNPTDKFPDCVHGGKANAFFLDGHVESLTQAEWDAKKGTLPTNPASAGTPLSIFWLGV